MFLRTLDLRSLRPAPKLTPNLSVLYSSFDAQTQPGIHLGPKYASYESIWILNPRTTFAKKRMFTEPLGAISRGRRLG